MTMRADKTIGVDIDGVIADCITPLRKAYSDLYGRTPAEPTTWELESSWGVESARDIWARFVEAGGYSQCSIYHESVKTLTGLQQTGVRVMLITARSTQADPVVKHKLNDSAYCRWQNFQWLTSNEIPYDRLFYSSTKLSHDYDLIVDDNPDTIGRVVGAGKEGYLFRRPWNEKK